MKWTFGVVALGGLLYLLWSIWDHDALMEWLETAHPLPFFVLMALLPTFGLPITPFFIVAGAAFEGWLAATGSAISLGLSLGLCYLLARPMRPWLESLLGRFGYKLPDFRSRSTGTFRFLLAVKLAPGIPASLKNYGLAVSGIPFLPYFVVSMLVTGTYGIAIILLGNSLFEHERNRAVLVVSLLAVLALGAWWWRRRGRSKGPGSHDAEPFKRVVERIHAQ